MSGRTGSVFRAGAVAVILAGAVVLGSLTVAAWLQPEDKDPCPTTTTTLDGWPND